jgi:hypothetical protein
MLSAMDGMLPPPRFLPHSSPMQTDSLIPNAPVCEFAILPERLVCPVRLVSLRLTREVRLAVQESATLSEIVTTSSIPEDARRNFSDNCLIPNQHEGVVLVFGLNTVLEHVISVNLVSHRTVVEAPIPVLQRLLTVVPPSAHGRMLRAIVSAFDRAGSCDVGAVEHLARVLNELR